jgi:hypothetical protein
MVGVVTLSSEVMCPRNITHDTFIAQEQYISSSKKLGLTRSNFLTSSVIISIEERQKNGFKLAF